MNRPPRRLARRVGLLILGVLLWTLLAMYPNPAVFFRNIARYRHLPIDPTIEKRMGWDLPNDPANIEFFVDSLLVCTPDWPVYRVPWYVPTALEAARSTHGDCEAKTMLLASLLEGRKIPYQIRASFTHIWVDYHGRKERIGESRDIAYLEGEQGHFRIHWPDRVSVREFLTLQREQLWDVMPLARKAIWLTGLAWVALATALLGGPATGKHLGAGFVKPALAGFTNPAPNPPLQGDLVSQWRAPGRSYASRTFWNWLLVISVIILAPMILRRNEPVRWQFADLYEVFALSVVTGAFLAWLEVVRPRRSVSIDSQATLALSGPRLTRFSSFGISQRRQTVEGSSIQHFELKASPGGLRAWTVSAALRTGQRVQLLRYSREADARAALRRLGREFVKPILVRADRHEYWTAPDEIPLNLKERSAARPTQELPARPDDILLVEGQVDGKWALGYPRQQPGASRALLFLIGLVAAFAAVTTLLLVVLPPNMVIRVVWTGAVILLGMTTYGAMALREEVLAALAGAHVEIADGELSFQDSDGRVESLRLDSIESVEIGRKGDVPTLAIVSPERVLHLRLYAQPKHMEWVRSAIEWAVVSL